MAISVEDRQAILELVARYNQAFDYGDTDAWVKTFTPDGIFADSGGFSVQGTEELRAFATERTPGSVASRHWNTSHVIEGGRHTARVMQPVYHPGQDVVLEVEYADLRTTR